MRFFRRFRKKHTDPATLVNERWSPNFRRPRKVRFQLEDSASFSTTVSASGLKIDLKKSHVFAWAENPGYRYRDFVVEATLDGAASNGHSSVGLILRRADERNYYYFLIAPSGLFRFDVVFNGSPRNLIQWTECALPDMPFSIRIVVRGEYFGFYVDEEWIGEIEDDTVDAGAITFAAQNYGEHAAATYFLRSLTIDSRAYEVERQYYRWRRYIPVDNSRRLALARSLANSGNYSAALVQFGLAGDRQSQSPDDLMLMCECQVRTGLHKEANTTVEAVLKKSPQNRAALAEKASLLYLDNKIVELRDFLEDKPDLLEENAVLCNLLGNAWFSLGERDKAVAPYEKATALDDTVAMYRINAARCHEYLGDTEKAFDSYLLAAKILFRDEDYLELSSILPLIERLKPDDSDVLGLKGKIAFGEERYHEAEELLEEAVSRGTSDSSVFYLLGILASSAGRRPEGIELLRKATELEPEYYLYWFRLGEALHLVGEDGELEAAKALEMAPEDMWVLNLAGLIHLGHGRDREAAEVLERSYSQIADDEESEEYDEIIANYAEAVHRIGERERAFSLLEKRRSSVTSLNQLGNLWAKDGEFEAAAAAYERAALLDPDDRDVQLNYAAACIEADRILQAEEILARIIENSPDASAYNLMGNAALIKGELLRAEAAFQEALVQDATYRDAAANLLELYLRRKRFDDAQLLLDRYFKSDTNPRTEEVRKLVDSEIHVEIQCASCDRSWKAVKNIDVQPALRVQGELPDDSPAGACPECGKVYCIGCAKETLKDGRFYCPDCGEGLKLSDDYLRKIVSDYIP